MKAMAKCAFKNNRYDYLIIMTIVSVIFAGPLFGAFIPIRIIGFLFLLYYMIKIRVNPRIKIHFHLNKKIFAFIFWNW